MIRVSIFYPTTEGKTFDLAYYEKTHMPLAGKRLEPLRYEIDKGLGGGEPGAPPPFIAACHFYFDSLEQFAARIAVHGAELQADIPKYTEIAPLIQVSEIVTGG